MDFLMLMVRGRPQDRCVGRAAWKDPGEFRGCLKGPQHFLGVRSGRGCAWPFFDCKRKYRTESKGLTLRMATVSTKSIRASSIGRVDQRYWWPEPQLMLV